MHTHGLTHRDIKPSNVIFVGNACKLADIGLVAGFGERSYVGTMEFRGFGWKLTRLEIQGAGF